MIGGWPLAYKNMNNANTYLRIKLGNAINACIVRDNLKEKEKTNSWYSE